MFFNKCEPEILKLRTYLSTNLPMRIVGNAKTTRLGDTFETHCNIDTVAKDIIVFDDDITDVNATRNSIRLSWGTSVFCSAMAR